MTGMMPKINVDHDIRIQLPPSTDADLLYAAAVPRISRSA